MQHSASPKLEPANSNPRKCLTVRRAVESPKELVFITDDSGVVQYVNSACEILMGYDAREIVDTNINQIAVQLPKCKTFDSLRKKAIETGIAQGTTAFRCKNDSVLELGLAITVVLNPRTRAAMLACTGSAVAEQQNVSANHDSSGTDSLGAFTRGIAHDFNNLLMVIGAYAEMGLASIVVDHPVRRNLQEIKASVRRASDLSRRLLMFGRKNTGQQLISINWIVEHAASMLARIMEEDIGIRVSLGKNVGLIQADPGQLEEILLNLAINARDAMPDGGEFFIETRSVQLDEAFAKRNPGISAGKHVQLTVTDTGRGMKRDELSQIFEPYFTTKAEGKGTGLGLAIVQSIVHQSGGSISAVSEPGAGTSINIYLPVIANATEKPVGPLQEELPNPAGSELVLVVEDAEPVRESIVAFLSSLGYKTRSAAGGREALKILQESRDDIALIVVDVVMPRMSGAEFAQAAGALQPQSRILFVSGHAEEVVLRKKIHFDEANFLQKPFPLRSLAVKVRELIDQPRPARAAAASAGR